MPYPYLIPALKLIPKAKGVTQTADDDQRSLGCVKSQCALLLPSWGLQLLFAPSTRFLSGSMLRKYSFIVLNIVSLYDKVLGIC